MKQTIKDFLTERIDETTFVKTTDIATELEFPSRQVGQQLSILTEDEEFELDVEKFQKSSDTTWKIEP